jgi:2-polyprenyl-3-methyl-5-hydroxy-6-metoxy-1,4-benzoquinol methylase
MSTSKPLKPEEDAFGQKLLNAYKGTQVFEVVERNDGYIDAIDLKVYFSTFKEWPPIQQKAMNFVRGRVLDVGCGAGRHSIYLQKKGFDTLGIDISSLAISLQRQGIEKS